MSQRSNFQMPVGYGALADKLTTTNVYQDVGTIACSQFKTKHFVFSAATNNLLVQVLGSIDGGSTYPYTAETAIAVNSGATVTKTYTTPYTNMKVQVDPAVDNTHGTLSTKWMGAGW